MSAVRRFLAARGAAELALFFALAALGLATLPGVPWSDDARFYVPAAMQQARWLARVLEGLWHLDLSALGPPAITHAFALNAEHPPFAKFLMGVTWWLLHEVTGWLGEIDACRVANVALWAGSAAVICGWLRPLLGTGPALIGALTLFAQPRLWFHGHAETLDVPVSALCLMTAASLHRVLEVPRLRTALWTAVLFAAALTTKLNAPFVLLGAAVYVLLLEPPVRRAAPERAWRLPRVPGVLLAMLLLSPVLAWAMWPWLWYDSAARFAAYLRFHLQHYGILFYYRGVLYGDAVAPWHAPLVLTLLTVPLGVLALVAFALPLPLRAGFAAWREVLGRSGRGVDVRRDPRGRLALFALMQILAQLLPASLPGVPKYGGEKLFLPVFFFLPVLAALGWERVAHELRSPRARAVAAALVLASAGWGIVAHRGAWLSYYNELAGGVGGATAAGYERQYYDLAYPEIPAALTETLPHGGTVAFLPNPKEYTPYVARWQREGRLSSAVHLAPPERADRVVLTHERRWPTYPELMAHHRQAHLVFRHSVRGVPLFSIYARATEAPSP